MKNKLVLASVVFLFVSRVFGFVEPSRNIVFIFLSDWTNVADPYKSSGIFDYISTQVAPDAGNVYAYPLDVSSRSAADLSAILADHGENSPYAKAIENWFANSSDKLLAVWKENCGGKCDLKDLKKFRPDILPSRFVVLAEGVSGLVAREYIQGKDYAGDYSKVLFFDTPHEGTGFADQALFQGSKDHFFKKPDAKALAAVVPLALSAYVFGGSGALQDIVISIAKSVVLGMAQNAGDISESFSNADFFGKYSTGSDALWYLAQDASFDDKKYGNLISAAGVDVKNDIGAVQWLNATGLQTGFDNPSYGIVYSYGLPTIGNGRRTFGDFVEQSKNHISQERLKRVLTDSLTNALSAVGVDANEVKGNISQMAEELLTGNLTEECRKIAGELVEKYGALATVLSDSKLGTYIHGLSELRSLKINMDDLPGTALKILRVLDKFIPETYKSELYSAFIENFSPEVVEILADATKCSISGGSARNCVVAGLAASAKNLSNYGLNFFDEGTFDVPVYSAFGANVSAFRNANVSRMGYDLGDYIENDDRLKDYRELLSGVGKLEKVRHELDASLRIGCNVLITPYDEICKAAAFAANVVLIADISGKTAKLAKNMPVLKEGKYLSLKASVKHSRTFTYEGLTGSSEFRYPDLERLLFDAPKISIASVYKKGNGAEILDSIVPLVLYGTCNSDVYDANSLNDANNCKVKMDSVAAADSLRDEVLYESGFAERNAMKSRDEEKILSVKDIRYNMDSRKSTILGALNYWKWKAPTVRKFIYEYRFAIDDLQPDSLRQIRLDFNAEIQMAYERDGRKWNARLRIGGGEWSEPGEVPNPVRDDGLFVFRPKEFFDLKLDGAERLLSSIQKEGPNMVRLHVVNKLGLSGFGEFSYLFESTPPLLEPGWPKSFVTLSKIDHPYIYYNKQDVVPNFSDMKVSLVCLDCGNDSVGVATATYELVDESRGTYRISANMESLWKNKELKSGNYILEWEIGILDGQNKRKSEKLRTMAYVDREAPNISLSLGKKDVSGKNIADDWGSLTNGDPESDRSIRALRILVEKPDGSFVLAKSAVGYADGQLNFGWQKGLPGFEGPAKLIVQAVDYAYPSEKFEELLSSSVEGDEFTLWNKVVRKDESGNFVPVEGFNATILESAIVVDTTAPTILENSLDLKISRGENGKNLPKFRYSDDKKILGIDDTLKIGFEINEPLLGRDSTNVSVQIKFDDGMHGIHKIYGRDTVVAAFRRTFEFVEPEANRLADGVYDVSVEMIDNAGNAFDSIVYKGLVVDRTAPAVVELMNGDVSFADISELGKSKGFVSQVSDRDFNKSDLSCHAKVDAGESSTGWFFVGEETASKNAGTSVPFEFSVVDRVANFPDGLWTVRLGCFDGAGNYGEAVDFFGMGRRYPRITFPEDGMGDYFDGEVLIEGTTPNPVVKNGDERSASFDVEWCKADLSECGTENIVYLTKAISEQPKSLAIWRTSGLSGSYVIRLRVRGCDVRGENCDSAVTERTVSFANGFGFDDSVAGDGELPKLEVVEFPIGQVPAENGIIRLKLDGSDTSKWSLNASIMVRSPSDSSLFVPAKTAFFNTVASSPFDGEPETELEGLSVWRTGKTWNIRWTGRADAAVEGTAPHISLKYQKETLKFGDGQILPEEDFSVNMPAISDARITIPAYNAVRNWNIGENGFLVQFESDSAFVIDASNARMGDGKKTAIYCGKNSVPVENVMSVSKESPILCVFPNQYVSTVVWNGLTQENLYPGGSEVRLNAYAYKKGDKTKLVSCEKTWNQAMGDFKIIADTKAMNEFYVGFSSDGADDGKAFARAHFVFEFGIAGSPAYVSAEILDSSGMVVRKLMDNKFLLAGTSPSAYSVGWDGMSETGFASTKEGKYTLKITARRENETRTLSHDFELILANKLIPAPTEIAKEGEYPADLTIDEAILDEKGNLRYCGNPDYLLEADVTAVTLPTEQRNVEYRWTMDGTQHPVYFEKNRYSVGIHRHRKKFPVTVAVLLAGYGHDLTSSYNWKNRSYNYKVLLKKIIFEEGKSFDISEIKLEPWNSIVGLDKDGNVKLKMGFAVKIFPASVVMPENFSKIDDSTYYARGHFNHDSYSDPNNKMNNSDYSWSLIWNEKICMSEKDGKKCPQDTVLKSWWNNFTRVSPYWEMQKKTFYYDSGDFVLEQTLPKLKCEPSHSVDNTANGKFTCGEEDDFDVHKDMVKISVSSSQSHKNFSYGNYGCWCDNDGSNTDIGVQLKIEVKKDYWNPQYGYNNLANTFTRLDPKNIVLFDDDGYCNLRESPCAIFDGSGWIPAKKEGKVTAFEAAELSMLTVPENPLLFADEFGTNFNGELSKSTYSMKFYNAKDAPVSFQAAAVWNDGVTSERLDLESGSGADSVVMPDVKSPLSLSFYVAPKISAQTAAKSKPDISAPYPFAGDFANVEDAVKKVCDDCVLYKGLASGLHFNVGDWTIDDWNKAFLINGVVKNPLTATTGNPKSFAAIARLNDYIPNRDALDDTYRYEVDENDSKNLDYWKIPEKEFSETEPAMDKSIVDNGNVPSGKFKPNLLTPGWTIGENKNGEWFAKNEGTDASSTASFIWSSQKPWNYNRSDVSHNVSLDDVKKQDFDDEILGKRWMKKIAIGKPYVYVRGYDGEGDSANGTRKFHPYFTAEYDSAAAQFKITRSENIDYTSREPEKATLRGRVPGENQRWNLFFVQNGKQHFLKSGIQRDVPVESPYPILDYAEMNRIQGNTSFFLTYGGTKGEAYFRQLDLHVGSLLKAGEGGLAESMYGEISVDFKPGTWGENDVDVTVRTIPKAGEYNFAAFKNLDIVGPVIEILPSHDFSDIPDSLWPLVHVRLRCAALNGENPAEFKVYKPDFETLEITPLETQNILAFDKDNGSLDINDPDFDAKCGSVEIIAKTRSFSTFVVMDEKTSKKVGPADTVATEKYELVCGEMSADSLWAGTSNGWLEYPNPCSGKSNFLLQLRTGESAVAAEYRAASANPIVWNVRKSDIGLVSDVYGSRIVIHGVDGKTSQFRGPPVLVDSIAPTIGDVDVSVIEERGSRILQVDVSASDSGSGISKTRLDIYFGGNLLESRTVWNSGTAAEDFVLDRDALYGCVGCKATVKVSVEDFGHNHVEISVRSENLYPYPTSLALWYPLSEGSGNTAFEATGGGPDMDISNLKLPWQNGKNIRLFASDRALGKANMPTTDSLTAFSVELKFSSGHSAGTVFGWQGSNAWTLGVDAGDRYYMETPSGRTTFTAKAERNVKNHIVVTVDGDLATLYKNGALADSRNLGERLEFGNGGKPALGGIGKSRSITGEVSDIRIYRSALSPSQVSDLYRDGLDLSVGDIVTVRAATLDRGGLIVDQSCGVAGKSYLRQKTAMGTDWLTWNVEIGPGRYNLYILSLDYASKTSKVEVLLNGVSRGIYTVESTGLWKSVRVDGLSLNLVSGKNRISVKPIGGLGIAALALVDERKNLSADLINYGEREWNNPAPRVKVKMKYENGEDPSWTRPRFQLRNLTESAFSDVRLRYYYSGEGESVQAASFFPNVPMSVVPDAGKTFYGELLLTEAIPAYGAPYYGNGPQIGLHRTDYYFPWDASDDPSFSEGANNDYVDANGIALLDSEGFLLNDWNCYDADGPMEQKRKSARILAKDSKVASDLSSLVTMLVENTGEAPLDGFEVRYYYRDDDGDKDVDFYSSPFASGTKVGAGGNLYYVSFLYSTTILNPGEKSDFGNGVNFEIHNSGWTAGYDASEDPSHYGLNGTEFVAADSAIVLDLNGNLLWGHAPQPKFGEEYKTKDVYENLIDVENGAVYVNVAERGTYTLETVNAAGMPLVSLFNGIWGEGVHSVSLANHTFAPGGYLVLRRGNEILSWRIFK